MPKSPAATASLESAGRWAEAAALHRADALRLGPGQWDGPIKQVFVAYLMANELEAAQKLANECLEKSPSSFEVLYYLGDSQRVMMSYAEAASSLVRLLQLSPGHLRGVFSLAHVYSRLGRAAEALPLLEQFLDAPTAPVDLRPLAGVECARVLKRLGRPRDAVPHLTQVLEEFPYNTIALAEAAQIFSILGKPELARGLRAQHAWLFERGHQVSVEDESKIYSTGPTSEGGELRLALQAADRREFLDAISKLESLAASTPGDTGIAAPLARLWLRLFRYREVIRVVEAARARGAESADLARLEADAWSGLGRPDAAQAALLRASERIATQGNASLDDAPARLEIHLRAAIAALESTKDLPTARACLARVASLAPEDWRLLYGTARIQLETGDLKGALESLSAAGPRASSEGRTPIELRRWVGVAHGLSGDLRSAAREIMALVKEFPGEIENFQAFERVFGARTGEPEVARVMGIKKALEAKLEALEAAKNAAAEAAFRSSAQQFVALGGPLAGQGLPERAVDVYCVSAQLDPTSVEGLRRAAELLISPKDTFVRLWALREIARRLPGDIGAQQALQAARAELGIAPVVPRSGK